MVGSRRPLDLVWVALAAAGILLLAAPGGGGLNTTGVVLALIAGGWWAAYILLSARVGPASSRAGRAGAGDGRRVGAGAAARASPTGGSDLLQPEVLRGRPRRRGDVLAHPLLARARGAAADCRRTSSAC